MRPGFRTFALALAAAAALAPASAVAQRVLTTPEAVRECLCLRQATGFAHAQMTVAQAGVTAAREAFERIQAEIARRRPLVDPQDAAAVADFEALLAREEPARRAYNDEAVRAYNDAIARYRESVEAFNSRCGGWAYDPAVQAAVEANLVCPR